MIRPILFCTKGKEKDFDTFIEEKVMEYGNSFMDKFQHIGPGIYLNNYDPFHNSIVLKNFIIHSSHKLKDFGVASTIKEIYQSLKEKEIFNTSEESNIVLVSSIKHEQNMWNEFLESQAKKNPEVDKKLTNENPSLYYEIYEIDIR